MNLFICQTIAIGCGYILDLLIDSTSGYGITQIISAVFFLVVVYVASANYRSQMLPR